MLAIVAQALGAPYHASDELAPDRILLDHAIELGHQKRGDLGLVAGCDGGECAGANVLECVDHAFGDDLQIHLFDRRQGQI